MTIETLKSALPDYAKDLKLNIGSLANETILNDQQKYGCMLACAYAVGTRDIVSAMTAECETRLTPEAAKAAKAAAAIMGMNNVYYRFVHLVKAPDYKQLPAKLRMNAIANPGVDKADFELWSLCVSAINGCGMCMESHEAEVRKHGVTAEQVQAVVRIASVVSAVAAVKRAEAV